MHPIGMIECFDVKRAKPCDLFDKAIICFGVSSNDCQTAADLATVPIFKRRHPILAIKNDLAHFPRLNLRYVRQLSCS